MGRLGGATFLISGALATAATLGHNSRCRSQGVVVVSYRPLGVQVCPCWTV